MKDYKTVLKDCQYTHMPYLFYQIGQPRMLFTVMQDNFWKLYYTDFDKVYKINTPLDQVLQSKKYHMCQPSCYKDGDIYKVSFCIQFDNKINLYYCQSTDITNLTNLTLVYENCFGGCISPNYIMINNTNNIIYIINKDQQKIQQITDILMTNIKYQLLCRQKYLARTSYVTGNDKQLIISYADPVVVSRYGSIYLDLNEIDKQVLITQEESDGPIYKASIDPFTLDIYYGKKIGIGFEQRTIQKISINRVKQTSTKIIEQLK